MDSVTIAMTMKIKLFILFLLSIGIFGCSEEKSISSLPPTHTAEWMDPASVDFHGDIVMDRGFESCLICHGADFDGGKSEISCIDCHMESGACTSCHGGLDNNSGAPPYGIEGESSTSDLAVGAHTAHLESSISAPIECGSCHIVPAILLDTLHLDLDQPVRDSIAEINFSGLAAITEGTWNRDSSRCENLYCHGSFEGGYTDKMPIWNASGQAHCGSCHDIGVEPSSLGSPHAFHMSIDGIGCASCHASVLNEDWTFADVNLHVNGIVDTLTADPTLCALCHSSGQADCTICHGGTDNQTGAPPQGLEDETSRSSRAVGAHSAHVQDGLFADAFECEECHITPTEVLDTVHLDGDNIAEVTLSSLAGSSASYSQAGEVCNNVYCHGSFVGGNTFNPIWTDSSQTVCGSCHNVDSHLPWLHEFHVGSAGIRCSICHATVVDDQENIIGLDLHINGVADTSITDWTMCNTCHGTETSCDGCHGGLDNNSGAPPYGLSGEIATTERVVGAHTAHLEGNLISDGIECEECHVVPATVLQVGHLGDNQIAEITFGTLAGGSSSYNQSNATCSQTYCHGNFFGGNSSNVAIWNESNQAECGSCHPVSTNIGLLQGRHFVHVVEEGIGCYRCHSTVVDNSTAVIGLNLHIDGQVEVNFSTGNGTFFNNTCTGFQCHGASSWN